MDEQRRAKLKEQLDGYHDWPSVYMYKFIFERSSEKLTELKKIFPEGVEYSYRDSSGGKYTSVTIKDMALDAETIFTRYEDVSKIEGIIAI